MERHRLRVTIRDAAPCKDCTERFPTCHGDCPKDKRGEYGYQAWKNYIAEVQEKRKAYCDRIRNYRRS